MPVVGAGVRGGLMGGGYVCVREGVCVLAGQGRQCGGGRLCLYGEFIRGYMDGADDDVVFRFINKSITQGDPNILLINKENNSVIKDTFFQSDVYIRNANKGGCMGRCMITGRRFARLSNLHRIRVRARVRCFDVTG